MSDRVIFHIDVNSAYLSWEAVDRLENGETTDLRLIPSAVGGDIATRHGVILAKSVPAKKYRITTGEPVVDALRKCPELVLVKPRHGLYHEKSKAFINILRQYSDTIEQFSVDEAFVDMTGTRRLFGEPKDAADRIRNQVRDELGFTVNVGVSSNKLLAKMASDFEKPDRIHTLWKEEIPKKLWPLPIEDLYMVGRSSSARLRSLGITTIGELAHTDKDFLIREFKSHGLLMWEYANGIAPAEVHSTVEKLKGVGNSTTLSQDVSNADDAKKVLLALAEQVSSRLRKSNQLAQSVTVEIKYSTFQRTSHQKVLLFPTNSTQPIYELSCRLFDELWNHTPIRLLGIRTGKLLDEDAPVQMTLFDSGYLEAKSEKQQKLDAALDQIKSRYGENAVIRGSFFPEKEEP